MTNLDRVAREIKEVGLYNLILQDIQKLLGRERVEHKEILDILQKHPNILNDYKQTNVEYNLSNIHLREIEIESIKDEYCKRKAKEFNSNLKTLKEIEKYTLDFAQSSTLVIIFSVEFFVLFSVQYLIVLLNLKDWQWWIYSFFALSILVAWLYAKKEKEKYRVESQRFYKLYDETLTILEELESNGCVKKDDLWILESDEHV